MNEEEELKKLIGQDGEINLYYGGYEIKVINKNKFKWDDVFECLFKRGYSVFVTKGEKHINIVAKQVY